MKKLLLFAIVGASVALAGNASAKDHKHHHHHDSDNRNYYNNNNNYCAPRGGYYYNQGPRPYYYAPRYPYARPGVSLVFTSGGYYN